MLLQVLGFKPPPAYRTKVLVVYPTGACRGSKVHHGFLLLPTVALRRHAVSLPVRAGAAGELPAPLSLPIGPALTLQQVYEKVAEHFTLAGA